MKSLFLRGGGFFLLSFFLFQACVEPYEIEEDTFNDYLIVESTITNELKQHEVLLSRTHMLQNNEPVPERNANVKVTDGHNEFLFSEVTPGIYISINEFIAEPGIPYTLEILTANGTYYTSTPTAAPIGNEIEDLYADKIQLNGEEGIAIFLDNSGPPETTRFYKYEYEETYKIVSRLSANIDLIVEDGEIVLVCEKPREETICYNTVESDNIVLTNSSSYSQNTVEGLRLRFIGRQDPVISHRYSMLVKQYALTREAYTFFSTLKEISGSDNIFSQNQPGFIKGNLFSPEMPQERVIGYFNVASVSTKRMFFNFSDFYDSGEIRADFSGNCNPTAPDINIPSIKRNIIEQLQAGLVKISGENCDDPSIGPYFIVPANCIDCNYWGSNVVPHFWED